MCQHTWPHIRIAANIQGRSKMIAFNVQMRKLGLEGDLLKVAEQKRAGPGLIPKQVSLLCMLLLTTPLSSSLQITEEFGKKVKKQRGRRYSSGGPESITLCS